MCVVFSSFRVGMVEDETLREENAADETPDDEEEADEEEALHSPSPSEIVQNGRMAASCGRPSHLLQNGLPAGAGSSRSPSNFMQKT